MHMKENDSREMNIEIGLYVAHEDGNGREE